MDSSSLVDSFDRKSSSKASDSRDDSSRGATGELARIDAEVRKELDIGNEDVMVSILKEPAFDFDAAARDKKTLDVAKEDKDASSFSMASASKSGAPAVELAPVEPSDSEEFGDDRDSSISASHAHVNALKGAFDGSVKPISEDISINDRSSLSKTNPVRSSKKDLSSVSGDRDDDDFESDFERDSTSKKSALPHSQLLSSMNDRGSSI